MPALVRRRRFEPNAEPFPSDPLRPFWCTPGREHALYLGNVTEVLARLPERSVQCCVTSPPYWGLRSYDTGDAKHHEIGCEPSPDCGTHGQAQCGGCFVCSMVAVFRGVLRVLRDDGVLFLNLGDTYTSGGRIGHGTRVGHKQQTNRGMNGKADPRRVDAGLRDGNLVGVPWRVALALQADGWVLRSDIPWVCRNKMPESVQNRPCKSLEYVFLFAKRTGYFFDMEAVRKPGNHNPHSPGWATSMSDRNDRRVDNESNGRAPGAAGGRSFKNGDLWFESVDGPHGLTGMGDEIVGLDVTTRGYAGAHFATYSPSLITPLIKAGTSERGACGTCGAPWERVTEPTGRVNAREPAHVPNNSPTKTDSTGWAPTSRATDRWQPTCECHGRFVKQTVTVRRPVSCERNGDDPGGRDRSLASNRNGITGSLDGVPRDMEDAEEEQWVYESLLPLGGHPVVPCRVLDPFMGSGTTGAVCVALRRWSWGIDLSETYLREHAIKRLGQALLERDGPGQLAGRTAARVDL